MSLTFRRPTPQEFPRLGEICCNAFAAFQTRHGFEPDFPAPDVAEGFIRAICNAGEPAFAVAAVDGGGEVVGSNYCTSFDGIGGVGPITVDPKSQERGIGRRLMQAVLKDCDRRGLRSVRLMQDAHNGRSLSLYASLGFDQKACCATVQMPIDRGNQTGVRAMVAGDAPAVDRLSRSGYGHSRANEIKWVRSLDMPAFVLERGGRVSGYCIPFMLGHYVAEAPADAVAMMLHAAANAGAPHLGRFFVPLHEAELFRNVLAAGGRVMRTMNLMARGSYAEPAAVWGPSILL